MNNFNTLMQVYTALNMPVIDRLRRSWALVPKQDKEILKRVLTSPLTLLFELSLRFDTLFALIWSFSFALDWYFNASQQQL